MFATYSLTSPYKFENDLLSIHHADRIDGNCVIKVADFGLADDIHSGTSIMRTPCIGAI